jgi:hypothetical protein
MLVKIDSFHFSNNMCSSEHICYPNENDIARVHMDETGWKT